jgi:hypothetical protein
MVGTAFGTARLVELDLSADVASLFRSIRPFHYGGDGKAVGLMGLHFKCRFVLRSLQAGIRDGLYAMSR